jgi:hypothetical protein
MRAILIATILPLSLVAACGAAPPPSPAPVHPVATAEEPPPCAADQVRSFICDYPTPKWDVAGPKTAEGCALARHDTGYRHLASVEPFGGPGFIRAEHRDDPSVMARFDRRLTVELRAEPVPNDAPRSKSPGCCFSWCADLPVRARGKALPADLSLPCDVVYREWQVREGNGGHVPPVCEITKCIDAPEGGTSVPASPPLQECPAALGEPDNAGSALDRGRTAKQRAMPRRTVEDPKLACCYTWLGSLPAARQF